MERIRPGFKWCNHCKTVKAVNEFGKDKSREDGYYYVCRMCSNQKERERIYKRGLGKFDFVTCPQCGGKFSLLKLHLTRTHPETNLDLTNIPARSEHIKQHHKTMHQRSRVVVRYWANGYKSPNSLIAIPKEYWPNHSKFANVIVDFENLLVRITPSNNPKPNSKRLVTVGRFGHYCLKLPNKLFNDIKQINPDIKLEKSQIIISLKDNPELLPIIERWSFGSHFETSDWDLKVTNYKYISFKNYLWPENAEYVVFEYSGKSLVLIPVTRAGAISKGTGKELGQIISHTKKYKIRKVGTLYQTAPRKFVENTQPPEGKYIFKKKNSSGGLVFQTINRHYSKLPPRKLDIEEFDKQLAEFEEEFNQ